MPQPIFLAGLHRSGTTLLTRCLGEHPLIGTLRGTGVSEDEGQHLQSVFPPALEYGGVGRFAFAVEMHVTESSPLATQENARRLWESWKPYTDPDRPYFLEKSPPNLLKTRFLQALFPESRFIVVLRHPLAVAYATQKWSGTRIGELLRHWLRAHSVFTGDREHLRRVLVLSYEEFVAHPQPCLDRIYDFIGIDPVPATTPVNRGVNQAYFALWQRDRKRWLGRLSAAHAGWRYERKLQRFGYSLRHLGRYPPMSVVLLTAQAQAPFH
ncbi:MAG TPA: sulfotransferase [Longimicrobiaceae bacterium]|nr:sulfotransferase [Longimicrobiaceae bacterium]